MTRKKSEVNSKKKKMPDAVSIVLFLTAVIIVCFVVHIICQNHKFHKEQIISSEKISRLFDHLVVRRARQAKHCTEWNEGFSMNCMARGSFETFERIYDGSNPSLGEILGMELDLINDRLLKHEDILRQDMTNKLISDEEEQ
jgi:hypothetical protein